MTDASPEIVIARALANRRAHIYGAEAWVDDPALWRSHEFVTDTAAILSALDAAGYVIAPKGATEIVRAIADVIMASDPPTLSVELPQALTLRIALYAANRERKK